MDFGRLSGSLSGTINKQLAEQLLSNPLIREAAAQSSAKEEDNKTQAAEPKDDSALGNLLNQLANTLTQAVNEQPAPEAAAQQTAAPQSAPLANLLDNPVVKQLLQQLPLQDSLSLKVLLSGVDQQTALKASEFLSTLSPDTLKKVECCLKSLAPEDIDKGIELFKAVFGRNDDRVFYQQENKDVYYNTDNSQKLSAADLDKLLRTAYHVTQSGGDLGEFMEAATTVFKNSDYDDARRFLQVADTVMYRGEDLSAYYDFATGILEKSPHDFESNVFQLYTTIAHGGRMQDYIDIANSLQTTGLEGRNNMVDFTRIVIDFRKSGGYPPVIFDAMAHEARTGGDVRQFMDDYMAVRGLQNTAPDFSRFDRIERIDGDPMVITEGESAALFAQAISSRDGLLPESVLYWSSLETGAMSHGSSYLDLSQLKAGTYHIAVKIGGYGGGTDTAIKTVIVQPGDGSTQSNGETTVVGSTKPKGDRGHGNDADGVDEQNPGNSSGINPNKGNGHNGAVDDGDVPGAVNSNSAAAKFVEQNVPQTSSSSASSGGGTTATGSTGSSTEAPKVGAAAGTDQQPDTTTGNVENEIEQTVVQPYTKEEATQITRDALAKADGGDELGEIASLLNERYYKALDSVVGFNQDYARRLQDYMSERSETADKQLKQLLDNILGELTGVAPQKQTGAANDQSTNPFAGFLNPYR